MSRPSGEGCGSPSSADSNPRPTGSWTGGAREVGLGVLGIVVVAASIAVRVRLYRDLPALLTNDSWDYLNAAIDIRRSLDFFTGALRDVRLPGYPTLLAVAYPLTGLRSDGIVLLQIGLGLASVAIGWTMGRLVGSRSVSVVMAAFLGLNPVYLLYEHAVMSEAFSLTLYAAIVAVGLASRRPGAGWTSSVGLGLVLGLAILTRPNVVMLGAVLVLGMGLSRAMAGRPGSRRRLVAAMGYALVPVTVASLVVAPWVWRNRVAYGHASLYGSANSNILVYKDMHAPLDGSAPRLASVNRRLGRYRVDFEWQQRLQRELGSRDAEEVARAILLEQIAAHPWRHVYDVGASAAGLLGFNATYGNERTAVRFWFRAFVGHVHDMNRLGRDAPGAAATPGWIFVPRARDRWRTRTFARVGELVLFPGRAIASVAFFSLMAVYLRRRRLGMAGERSAPVVALLATGYLGTLAMHAVMLTDYDRYATLFDFVAVLIAAAIVDDMRWGRRPEVPTGRADFERPLAAWSATVETGEETRGSHCLAGAYPLR